MIRELEYQDYEAASRVLWLSFYHAEKNNYSMDGMERFRDLTSPLSLSMNSLDPKLCFYGYFQDSELVAVGALKEFGHILLLYVHPDYKGKGIGSTLLEYMEEKCTADTLTVNSSDGAVSFYEKHGYKRVGERVICEELIHTPMNKCRKSF